MRKHLRKRQLLFILPAFVMAIAFGASQIPSGAIAGPEVVGHKDGSVARALIGDGSGGYTKIVYFGPGVKTMSTANTPVASSAFCGLGDKELFNAQVQFTGTMAGTAPTLAVKWQNSVDGGRTWSDVGTWTTINATVTPATQNQVVSDIWNTGTAVAFGDCWRSTYTFGGSGTVTANFSITGAGQ